MNPNEPVIVNLIPRMIRSDAYTVSSAGFESDDALTNSCYYGVFRCHPSDRSNETNAITTSGDRRMLFSGMRHLCQSLFHRKVTHEEIQQAEAFYKGRKFTLNGFKDFEFAKPLWERVVNEFDGYIPIKVEAMPEGSTVYPNMPNWRVSSNVDGMGPIAAWFENTFLKNWAASARLTNARIWLDYMTDLILAIQPKLEYKIARFKAQNMTHDFGGRASMCPEENFTVASQHMYCFPGTDTFDGAYANWLDGAPQEVGSSIWALAHRIVQGFVEEGDCYTTIYERAEDGSLLSMVGDLYDYHTALHNYLVPLALRSVAEKNNKIIVARPDSGDYLEMVVDTVKAAIDNGLYTEDSDGWKSGTTLRFIQGDSMTFTKCIEVIDTLIEMKCLPWEWGVFGVGGFLRNGITRDHLSGKYALASVGAESRPVIKESNTSGKRTYPDATVVNLGSSYRMIPRDDTQNDARIIYYDGTSEENRKSGNIWGPAMYEDFSTIQARVLDDWENFLHDGLIISPEMEALRASIASKYVQSS